MLNATLDLFHTEDSHVSASHEASQAIWYDPSDMTRDDMDAVTDIRTYVRRYHEERGEFGRGEDAGGPTACTGRLIDLRKAGALAALSDEDLKGLIGAVRGSLTEGTTHLITLDSLNLPMGEPRLETLLLAAAAFLEHHGSGRSCTAFYHPICEKNGDGLRIESGSLRHVRRLGFKPHPEYPRLYWRQIRDFDADEVFKDGL
ncbi:hypothetical protein [Arthrobacter mobilis]|uniref:Uncharacterized protein n=1 Tax=Arthrobacter mobilis TaxID=2724944 RepID=A0A7X6K6T9_9MICC|nr:hypothetical protein [Arthrobacter mobilis]NKX55970.1 hypothetical protein [Arthrobacter mobilis]